MNGFEVADVRAIGLEQCDDHEQKNKLTIGAPRRIERRLESVERALREECYNGETHLRIKL